MKERREISFYISKNRKKNAIAFLKRKGKTEISEASHLRRTGNLSQILIGLSKT